MKRKHRLCVGLSVMVSLAFLPLCVAVAQDEEPPAGEEHVLVAYGYGLARVSGWGSVDIQAHGASVIWITGADTLEIGGDGEREDMDGTVKLASWEGEIHVEGEQVGVRMAGGELEFTAQGRGRAFLQGYGTFQVDEREGRWRWPGVQIPPQPVARVVRERVEILRERLASRAAAPRRAPARGWAP